MAPQILSEIPNGFGDGFITTYNIILDEIRISKFNSPKTTHHTSSYIKVRRKDIKVSFGSHRGQTNY